MRYALNRWNGFTLFLDDGRVAIDSPPWKAAMGLGLEDLLSGHGASFLGPVATVDAALGALDAQRPDAVLLDVNVRGRKSTPLAAALREAEIPFVLVTGYSRSQLDGPELRDAPIVPKPVRA